MITIAGFQLAEGLRDAKFIFIATIVLVAFVINAFSYSAFFREDLESCSRSERTASAMLEQNSGSLRDLSNCLQKVVMPPTVLAFLADGGMRKLPDTWSVNAFILRDPERTKRGNRFMPVIGSFDWSFIVGTLMTLLSILVSYGAICGEKRSGTLRMILSSRVSRMSLFIGKYLGLLAVTVIPFLLGGFLSIVILHLNNALPLTEAVLQTLGWVVCLSILCISVFILFGMAVSSMVVRPVVALVVVLIGWILVVIVVPGLARLTAERIAPVRANFEIEREIEAAAEAVAAKQPNEAFDIPDNEYRDSFQKRAQFLNERLTATQRVITHSNEERIHQAKLLNTITYISPTGLLNSSLQDLSGTGVFGFETLLQNARRYQLQLHDFAVHKDSTDPDSWHLVSSSGTQSEWGFISEKPVSLSEMPKWNRLWLQEGLAVERAWPFWQLVLLIAVNLQMAIIAFIALLCYDPR
jgi:ABC-type transport system involved in multi-copper enzyme maturation permease subunit